MGRLRVDKAFLAADSFTPGFGFSTQFTGVAEVKGMMLKQSREHFMMMDASKVHDPCFMRFAQLTDFQTIIMDYDPSNAVSRELTRTGSEAKLILTGPSPDGRGALPLKTRNAEGLIGREGTPTSTRCMTTSHAPTINRSSRQPGSRAGGQRCAHSRADRNGGTRYQQSRTQREARAVQSGRPWLAPHQDGRMSHPLSATSTLARAQVLSRAYIFENNRKLAFDISDIIASYLLKRK